MIQELGINISAQGAAHAAQEFNNIASSLQKLKVNIQGVHAGMQSLNTVNLTPNVAGLERASASIARFSTSTIASVNQVKASIAGLQTSLAGLNKASIGTGAGGGGMFGGGAGSHGSPFGSLGNMAGFMARWTALLGVIRAVEYGTNDILMGKARKGIAEEMIGLAAISADKGQRGILEGRAHEFSQKYPVVTSEEYLRSASQTGSALNINKLGAGKLANINEANILAAKMMKQSPESLSENVSKIESAHLAQFPGAKDALESGKKVNLPGYGMVGLEEYHKRNLAMSYKVVEKTNLWGQGLMDFWSYAGSSMLSQGGQISDVLTMAGVVSDLGFKGAKAGRMVKSLGLSPEALSNLVMLGQGQFKMGMSPDEKRQYSEQRRPAMARVSELSGTAAGQAELGKLLLPGILTALNASKDPNIGLSLVKDLGLSRESLPQLLSLYSAGGPEKIKALSEDIKGANYQEIINKMDDVLGDSGNALKKLSNSWAGFAATASQYTGEIVGTMNHVSSTAGIIDTARKFLDDKNKQRGEKTFKEGLLPEAHKQGVGEGSNIKDGTPEEIKQKQDDLRNRLLQEGKFDWQRLQGEYLEQLGTKRAFVIFQILWSETG